jgi:TrmH family RNA methyltransferase
MQEIISLQNTIIKETAALNQKKYRAETGLFLIEGLKGVEEALQYKLDIKYIFIVKQRCHSEGFSPKNLLNSESSQRDRFFASLRMTKSGVYIVDEKIMKKISTTETPPEILAVASQVKYTLEDLFKEKNPLIIVLENIKDAGNLGTIIRTAKAANVSGIILTGDCTDIHNPKVVRSSAANLWKIPVVNFKDTINLKGMIEKYTKCQYFAAQIQKNKKQNLYYEVNYKKPTVVFFGSEADGISEKLGSQADIFIKIPINEEVESLNLSISAGIIIYEAFRQRFA